MIYRFSITTLKGTTATARKETILSLRKGVIHRIEIDFRPGNLGTLHLAIRRGARIIWPSNPNESFSTDDRLITFNEYYELFFAPYHLVAETWNESKNINHELVIRIGLLPRKHVVGRII